MSYYSEDFDQMEREELRREDRAHRSFMRKLAAHPHPNDPDHPDDEEDEPETRVCISCGGHVSHDGTLPCGH